ncbi:hypothetical protein NQ315_012636 [Exocentrus adspersus]|uniref:RING-type domain-containing protein n=1 Tax=Exocentrus adspersus TaxID=1586481 RepID=A0AAV8VSX4_9CUCU|nr:hypothetical protein NQ315_012636 [Exocentrus adspersus]
MTLQIHPIALGCMLVVAVGTLVYTYMTTRQQPQPHAYGPRGASTSFPYRNIEQPTTTSHEPSSTKEQQRKKRKVPEQCSICLGTMSSSPFQSLKTLACQHIFHSHCITMWLNSQSSCPLCRREAHV